MNNRRAFTLVELLVVISIIGLLSTIAIASMGSAREKARIAAQQQYDSSIYRAKGDQLIGAWNLDETSGTSIADSSGNNNSATLNGTVASSTYVAGIFGGAINFDGATNYIRISKAMSVTLNSFAVTAWFKTGSAGDQKIVSADPSNHFIQTLAGYLRVCTNNFCAPLGNKLYNDGNWHFAVVTGDDVSTRGYVDGALQVTQTAYSATISSATWNIGATGSDNTLKFGGSIDQVRIYGTALTALAIEKLYAAGLISHPRLVAETRPL